jgi:alpha/beta superfamily hydrolase
MVDGRRVDHEAGVTEEAEFFGTGADRLFGIKYAPISGEPLAAVVICEPILAQFRAHYRSGTLTARALAGRGLAVQRFHYRGMGNSDGDIRDMDLSSMTEDVIQAGSHLGERAGSVPIAYLGVNVGAYPAAVASAPDRMLILDSPPPSGRTYFRNALRAHGVYRMRKDSNDPLTAEAMLEALREPSADVSLLGCRLGLGLYESLSGTSILDEIGESRRPILFFGLGSEGALRPEGEQIRETLAGKGFPVEIEVRDKVDPFWYVENSAPEDQPETEQTANRVTEWVQRLTAGVGAGKAGDNA